MAEKCLDDSNNLDEHYGGYNKLAGLQGRKLINIMDNCLAHAIYYSPFDDFKAVFLPPNLTSELQPVDASIGRSFKCAFRRLLANHILAFVEEKMKIDESVRPPFKLYHAVTTYDAFCMMSKSWNMVPKTVVLNGWLSCKILAPHQVQEIVELRERSVGIVERAVKPQVESSLNSEKSVAAQRATEARQCGEMWLRSIQPGDIARYGELNSAVVDVSTDELMR